MVRLATAYLLRVRETGDATYYTKAEALLTSTLATNPAELDGLIAASSLAAARHEFGDALAWARQAVAAAPERPAAFGVLADALVELGRYEEAVDATQSMVNLRPDQASYARISYLRELHGDTAGAISAMRQAIGAGAPDSEATAWSEYQLGNLLFAVGDLDGADRAYVNAGLRQPGYVYSVAGRARIRAARGDLSGAATLYEQAVSQLPLPEFAASLGDVYERMGQVDQAARQHELVVAFQRLQAANGVNVDVDLALYNADRDIDLEGALDAARLEFARRPSVHVADILAWIEYRTGDLEAASEHSAVAMHLGSRDPLTLYRAGVIAKAVGDDERASALLATSHELNPQFSIRWAADLAQRMAALDDEGGQG
jgi:tetratricopeptide (TPR) repeat protein